jgi:hypothetical protein
MDNKIVFDNVFSVDNYYNFAEQTGAEIITIGYSVMNRPIQVLKKGKGKIKVIFTARIHGNEPATTQAILDFFVDNDFDELELYGVFLANPDGATLYEELWLKNPEAHWSNNFPDARLNANKVDLNRDWYDLSQPETRALRNFIMELRPDFIADFHEYYWSDKGYPPKNPMDDEGGFLATMTDAPFIEADEFVQKVSSDVMDRLVNVLEEEFKIKIKLRHFIGEGNKAYSNPILLGPYVALRGIPKLLVETWGTACSTSGLTDRMVFHKRAMAEIIKWIITNSIVFENKTNIPAQVEFDIDQKLLDRMDVFTKKINDHGLKFKIKDDKSLVVHCNSMETGFLKTIYNKIFE